MFTIVAQDARSRARAGIIHTAHGDIPTPAYAIVGTNGVVRCIDARGLVQANTAVVMVNTYHRWQELGEKGLNSYPGLHADMGWSRPIMTDSGGFQVFSLGSAREQGVGKFLKPPSHRPKRPRLNRITDDGVYFTVDGKQSYLDAKTSMDIQRRLGADILFAFDECSSPLADYAYTKRAMQRTHRWAEVCIGTLARGQLLFGIVQGGRFRDLRQESARVIGSMPFDGLAIGGSFGNSYGDSKLKTYQELDWVIPLLGDKRPRHLLGIGRIEDVLMAVGQGIDTFDCVVPTREARHGWIWTRTGRLDITRPLYTQDARRLDPDCSGWCCAAEDAPSRREVRDLFKSKHPRGAEVATFHNIRFFNTLMEDIRTAIIQGTFSAFTAGLLTPMAGGGSVQ